jgi:tetratricopeptide (TPR) repeat protein
MPPEQWRGEGGIDFRADMYAVGCMLYELLTGKWLYDAQTIPELRAQHFGAPIPALNNSPSNLKLIMEGCLAKRREERYARLDELLAELIKLHEAHSDDPLLEVRSEALTAMDFTNRGLTFGNLGQYQRAIADFDEAVRLDPTLVIAFANRANSYAALGRHGRAIADFDAAICLDPNYAQAWLNKGVELANKGYLEESLSYLEHVAELGESNGVPYTTSVQLMLVQSSAQSQQDEQEQTIRQLINIY